MNTSGIIRLKSLASGQRFIGKFCRKKYTRISEPSSDGMIQCTTECGDCLWLNPNKKVKPVIRLNNDSIETIKKSRLFATGKICMDNINKIRNSL